MPHRSTLALLTLLLLNPASGLVLSSPSTIDTPLSSSPPAAYFLEASPASTASPAHPTPTHTHHDLKERQGIAVAGPAATLGASPDQMSPITIYPVYSYPPGGGAPVEVDVRFTQTFAPIPDQWPSAVPGVIGMGTIKGEIGVVKSKRFVPFVIEEGVKTASSFTA